MGQRHSLSQRRNFVVFKYAVIHNEDTTVMIAVCWVSMYHYSWCWKIENKREKDGNIIFNGVVKGLEAADYTVEYTGQGYMDVTYADSTIARVYANANDNTRTIAQVAKAAIEDSEIDATDYYTEEQYKLLCSFFKQQEA